MTDEHDLDAMLREADAAVAEADASLLFDDHVRGALVAARRAILRARCAAELARRRNNRPRASENSSGEIH